ncbi:MAG TPA: bacillithiol system redox-active protein YtxJ [Flavobacterium sp.]|nr:bacillithiol system redox-active protein YtxJ [Flavobacterium sp.]
MGILNSIFGKSESNNEIELKLNWKRLEKLEQLDSIPQLSNEKPILIFKHSTRCVISKMALKQFENEFNFGDRVEVYFLDLLNYREISNEIASRFDVYHQSPQLILIQNGKAIYDASHQEISANKLEVFLSN